jgi:predicted amidohydrolase
MNALEETIEATLDSNGDLQLTHQSRLPPGPVQVTIRVAAPSGAPRGLADVIREIRADQIARGFHGRSTEELRAEEEAKVTEDAERDLELDAARGGASTGGP